MKPVFLIDCDGTLYCGSKAVPYAREFIEYLNINDYEYLLLTNCPFHSASSLSKKLSEMKINVNSNHIVTSGIVTAHYLKKQYNIKRAYVLGSNALKNEFKKLGIKIGIKNPDAVVIGHDPSMQYNQLEKAVQLVYRGARLFSTNSDNCIPSDNTIVPHTGSITAAVEYASGKKAITFGKPEHYMVDFAVELLSAQKNHLIMVGDRLDTDIQFAVNCGIKSYLVQAEINQGNDNNHDVFPTNVYQNLYEIILDLMDKE